MGSFKANHLRPVLMHEKSFCLCYIWLSTTKAWNNAILIMLFVNKSYLLLLFEEAAENWSEEELSQQAGPDRPRFTRAGANV